MTTVRSLAASACALLVLAGTGGEAAAQSQVCVDLQARLVALDRGTTAGDRQSFQEYDQSVRQLLDATWQVTGEAGAYAAKAEAGAHDALVRWQESKPAAV